MSSHQYPEDEFDQAGKESPVGVHRGKPSQWKTVLPFILVLVLVPALAWIAVSLIGNVKHQTAEPQATTTAVTEVAPTTEAPNATTAAPEPTTTEAKEEADAPSKDVDIQVLNGTSVNGLAAQAEEKLRAEGYERITAANASGWLTEVSTIYYGPGAEKGAEALGKILGVENMSENADVLGQSDFIIVLRDDYTQ